VGPWTFKGFDVHSYGFMLMLAFIVGILWTVREARKRGRTAEEVLDVSILVLVLSIVFARIVYVLLNLSAYLPHPIEIAYLWAGGLSFHGGLAGGFLAGLLYARRRKVGFWQLADLFTPGLPLSYAIARIGCFLNGCCYGIPTSLAWACRFYSQDIPGALTAPSHPVQLYDAAANLVLFFVIGRLKGREHANGVLFFQYIVGYSFIRILAEILRRGVTARTVFGLPITEAQVASALLIILGVFLIRRWSKKGTKAKAPK
jgi:phosphatidylglycerol:prolipoprotein diacylglycerol transferase